MKNFKMYSILLASLMGVGAMTGLASIETKTVETRAEDTVKTISEICGFTRIVGQNSKTFIAFSAKETLGTYQQGLTGNVFDAKGNAMPLVLYPNGGASGEWTGEGTRRYELKTDSTDFLSAIGDGSTFYITRDSVFDDGSTKIKFAKEYALTHIYDGGCAITEANYADASLKIAEAVARPATAKFRLAANSLSGISDGFTDIFKGEVVDAKGDVKKATLTDAADGSTDSGNRKIHIELDSQASDNTFFIKKGDVFYNTTLTKKLTFVENYKIANTTLTVCDGVTHAFGDDSVCDVCGYEDEPAEPITYTLTHGTNNLWSAITVGANTEINLKMGVTGIDAEMAATYRGTGKLDGADTNVKVSVDKTNNCVRLYAYVENGSDAATAGHLFIDKNTVFNSDPAGSQLQFSDSFYVGYDNANHVYFCNGTSHNFGSEVKVNDTMVATCKGCGYEQVAPIYTAGLGSTDKWASVSTKHEVTIKVGSCTGLAGAAAAYRGNALLNGQAQALKITVDGTILRIWMFLTEGHAGCQGGTITIDGDTMFKADGDVLSYLNFGKSINITYDTTTNKYRIDNASYEFVTSEVSNITKKNWVSRSNGEVALSYINVALSNDAVTTASAVKYRGKASIDGTEKDIRIELSNVSGSNKLAFCFAGEETGSISISKNTEFKADVVGSYYSASEAKVADTIKLAEDFSVTYDAVNNLVNVKNVVLSFSGTGAWSQQIDSQEYNNLASFNSCTIEGIHEDESELHPQTGNHRGYHFYGTGYDKKDDTTEVPVDIWISEFANGDATLNQAEVKAAVYTNITSTGDIVGVKLHQNSSFICSAYNMIMTLDADYLIKWFANTSRTTAGKYNDDKVGPSIIIDTEAIEEYTEGDDKPTLAAAVSDDVDDFVTNVSQTWPEGSVDANDKLVAGTWTVVIEAKDAAGNEAEPVSVTVVVKAEEIVVPPVDEDEDNEEETEETPKEKSGCLGSITAASGIITIVSLLGAGLAISKRKEDK